MKIQRLFKKNLHTALIVGLGLLSTACIDENYDFSQDIDLTMGFGSEGLALKLGSTGKVFLDEIIETDNTLQTDQNNVFYLAEGGSTETDFHIDNVSVELDKATLHTHQRIVNFKDIFEALGIGNKEYVNIPNGYTLTKHGSGETDKFELKLDDVQKEIIKVSKIYPGDGTHIRLKLRLDEAEGMKFALTKVENLVIEMPEYLVIKDLKVGTYEGSTIHIPHLDYPEEGYFCDITVDHLDLKEDGVVDADHSISIPTEKSIIKMSGDFTFQATDDFHMEQEDYVDADLEIHITSDLASNNNTIDIKKVVGKFNPTISPITESIDIAKNLPDFLKDDEVKIKIANPTIKVNADLTDIPFDLFFSGEILAKKYDDSSFEKKVSIPANGGEITLKGQQKDLLYIYQTDQPYDPTVEGRPQGEWHQVTNLSTLIEEIPDYVGINIAENKIHIDNDKEHEIELGRDYHVALDYDFFVPFEIENGLCIVYNDSTDSFGGDLEDFQAKGLIVNGKILSTIPLAIEAVAVPLDKNGKELPGVTVSPVTIAASDGISETASDIALDITLSDPALLQKVDRLKFKFKAVATNETGTHTLTSNQYLQLKDLRLKLKGQIVGNFN